jgi:hypothetical protein
MLCPIQHFLCVLSIFCLIQHFFLRLFFPFRRFVGRCVLSIDIFYFDVLSVNQLQVLVYVCSTRGRGTTWSRVRRPACLALRPQVVPVPRLWLLAFWIRIRIHMTPDLLAGSGINDSDPDTGEKRWGFLLITTNRLF